MDAIGAQTTNEARTLAGDALAAALVDAGRRTAGLVADFDARRSDGATGWRVPCLPTINPPAWEVGHLAWFTEHWTLRDPRPGDDGIWRPTRPSLLAKADRWFDSGRVAHDTRWTLDLPSRDAIAGYVAQVLDATCSRLAGEASTDTALYPYRLVLFHHDMHNEALTCLRQTIDRPEPARPAHADAMRAMAGRAPSGADEIAFDGGRFTMGRDDPEGFAFDNERRAVDVTVAPFAIDRAPVTNRAYARFVDDGGYRQVAHWSVEGRAWLAATAAAQPRRWRRGAAEAGWEERWFGAWRALPMERAACHVNAFEAEAYAAWAGRRLPTEAEWEFAATAETRSARTAPFRWGDEVWEWTATPFGPYPGFEADRYRDYSAPWFGTHRAVRGASFATHPRMVDPRYRNFYTPPRDDLFVGFRTCACGVDDGAAGR